MCTNHIYALSTFSLEFQTWCVHIGLEHEGRFARSIMKSISIFPDHDLTQRQIITQVLGASLAGTLIGCESTFGCKVKPTLNRFTNAEGNN